MASDPARSAPNAVAFVAVLFFASGASGLAFETLWFHQAGLAVGNGVWASALVLAAFMGGMGLGNWFASRWGDVLRRPLSTFAVLEVTVGVAGVAVVHLLPTLGSPLAALFRLLEAAPLLSGAVRFVVAFVLLALPATAMGMTLPVLVRALVGRGVSFEGALGLLYGLNTLGAVCGVLVTELFLVRALGIAGSALLAGLVDVAVGAGAWVLARRLGHSGTRSKSDAAAPARRVAARGGRVFLGASFATGLIVLGLEVVWLRVLLLLVNDTPQAFAAVLAAVLAGIGTGALTAGWLLRRAAWMGRHVGLLVLTAGALGVLGYRVYPSVVESSLDTEQSLATVLVVALPLVFPATFASGLVFTALGERLREVCRGDAVATGRLAFANTTGSALGPILAGFFLLPSFGMEASLALLLGCFGALGLVVTALDPAGRPPRPILIAGAVWLAVYAAFPFGDVRDKYLRASAARWMSPGDRVEQVREGIMATLVHIAHHEAGLRTSSQIATNAYSMTANDFAARRYMELFAVLPLSVHPKIERALVVGYGMGNTAGALLWASSLTELDIVDTSSDMLAMSRAARTEGEPSPLDDPRVRLHIEDGRHFMQGSSETYDLITGEPPPPIMAGVWGLYSREYFEIAKSCLSPGGMVTHWLPTMNLTAGTAWSIVRAFCDVFDDCSLWHGSGQNFMLLGSRDGAGPVAAATLERLWRTSDVLPELRAVGLEMPEQLGALFIAGPPTLGQWTRGHEPLTDNWPKRMFQPGNAAEKATFLAALRDVERAAERFESSEVAARLFPADRRRAALPLFQMQHLLSELLFRGPSPLETTRTLHRVIQHSAFELPVLLLMKSSPDVVRALAESGATRESVPPDALRHIAAAELARRDFVAASKTLGKMPDEELPFRDLRRYVAHVIAESEKLGTDPRGTHFMAAFERTRTAEAE